MGKLKIRFRKDPALSITRKAIKDVKLCYIACANKEIPYSWQKRSKIVYIGTTKKGAGRVAASAAYRAPDILGKHGINYCDFYIVTCSSRQGAPETWTTLERDLILTFKKLFGKVPLCNAQYKNEDPNKLSNKFSESRLINVIEEFSS